ncbi:MAG: phosphotransferase [Candidatus Promineifilaceae bacterium]
MFEKPSIQDQQIAACLHANYGISAVSITFLPLGADQNTAVYRIEASNHPSYFLKLRSGPFNPASVILPHLLQEQGFNHIIGLLPTTDGRLYTTLGRYKVILSSYVEGQNGYQVPLSDEQMVEFGRLLKQFHTTQFLPSLLTTIHRETYSSQWRDQTKDFFSIIETTQFTDPLATELAAFLKTHRSKTLDLVNYAQEQAEILQSQPLPSILCHADVHAGNIHITADNTFYLIDWDTLILAPKERDLMSIGAGLMGSWRTPQQEEALFYQGYNENGRTPINQTALTYYRSERIIEDIAISCQQIFSIDGIIEDREQTLYYLKSNYHPGSTIDLAYNNQPANG